MSELRHRPKPISGSENVKPESANSNIQQPPPAAPATVGGQASRRRSYALIGAFLILSIAFFALRRNGGSQQIPQSYALCSRNGDIYTVDEEKPRVQCLVVHDSHILDTGGIDEVRQRWGDNEITGPVSGALRNAPNGLKIFFIKPGHIVVPGLADAHAHVIEYGFKRQLDLAGFNSASEVVERVKQYVISHPEILHNTTQWIQGMGWDQTTWPGGQFPTKADFDDEPLLRGRPISLRRVDGHALWVSSTVIDGIGEIPVEIDGGAIVRDDGGKPTGIFVDNAMSLISLPPWTEQQMLEYFRTTMKDALAHGLTSIHDAATDTQMISFFKKMAKENKLPMRLYLMGYVESEEYWGAQIPKLVNYGPAGRLNLRAIKLFTDGAIGSWGAALLEPYTDKPETAGLMRSTRAVLSSLVKNFFKDGFQVNIHCIGDRANNVVLDIFEDVLQEYNVTERRPRIEHAQIMRPDDLERISRLGVIPSVQPTHATSDMWYVETRLGPERTKRAYTYRTLLESSQKQVLPLGSDFPVEGTNPLHGFYAAVTRLSPDGRSPHGPDGWFADQRLTREQALKGMTLDAAYASFSETDLGSLTPGKRADFVVLDADIMTVPQSEILNTKVHATVVDGRVMYGGL